MSGSAPGHIARITSRAVRRGRGILRMRLPVFISFPWCGQEILRNYSVWCGPGGHRPHPVIAPLEMPSPLLNDRSGSRAVHSFYKSNVRASLENSRHGAQSPGDISQPVWKGGSKFSDLNTGGNLVRRVADG